MDYDDDIAKREGWALFVCDDNKVRIQRLDDPQSTGYENMPVDPIFESDEDAIVYVTRRANEGSKMHGSALVLHETEND